MKLLPKNVLIIDDSLTLRKFIEKALTGEDCVNRLFIAATAQQGLDLAVSVQPDLIICDYTLPDLRGDELCRKLEELPETADIPIILMSSSGQEIGTLPVQETNIVRLLVKPFSKELLIATVVYVLGHWEERQELAKAVNNNGSLLMRGNTAATSLCNVLRFIEQQKYTGILRTSLNKLTLHAYCQNGTVRLVSTRQVDIYLQGTPFLSQGKKSPIWKKCEELQRKTLSPFLINLSHEGILPVQTAQTLTYLYGHRLFSRIWSEEGVGYEFEKNTLPDFIQHIPPGPANMNGWILESLRYVDFADEIQSIVEDPEGIPILTPMGYNQIQEMPTRQDEWQILTRISGSTPLIEICRDLQIRPDAVARKIFCFQRLGFVDYWPSYILQSEN